MDVHPTKNSIYRHWSIPISPKKSQISVTAKSRIFGPLDVVLRAVAHLDVEHRSSEEKWHDFWGIDQEQRGIGDFKTRDLDIRCVHKVWGVNQQEPLRFQHLNEYCKYQKWDFSRKISWKLCQIGWFRRNNQPFTRDFTRVWIDFPVRNLHEWSTGWIVAQMSHELTDATGSWACWLDDWIRSLSLRKPSFLQMGWTNYGYENHLRFVGWSFITYMWRCPKMGLPPNHPFLDRIFHYKPSSDKGVPPWLWKPPHTIFKNKSR